MEMQRTLKNSVVLEGQGLHTGVHARLVIKPAAVNHGIVFVRTDQTPAVSIPVNVAHVSQGEGRQTCISNGPVRVYTIEHLMAAFHGLGVDNAVVEINGDEVPGMDGSGECFAREIKNAGMLVQDAPRKIFVVTEPIKIEDNNQSITALPYENGLKLSYQLNYNSKDLKEQSVTIDITPEIFETEIGPARTFCLRQEAEYLRALGYGKGASLENTLVFEDDQPIQNTLRFPNEACRHKILDLLGDLYLLGGSLRAHVVAHRTGHLQNAKLVKKILEQSTVRRNAMTENSTAATTVYDINQIQKIIPHRYPFLLVDRIISIEPGKKAVGIKNVTINEHFFQGHFPQHPIMPGVLILEALAQVGGVLMLSEPQNQGKLAYFMTIDNVKFRQGVFPGDQLKLEAEVIKFKSRTGQCLGKAYVNEKLVCEAEVKFAIVDPNS